MTETCQWAAQARELGRMVGCTDALGPSSLDEKGRTRHSAG
ncbi:hypothetical protein [Streptomyces mesophilus]